MHPKPRARWINQSSRGPVWGRDPYLKVDPCIFWAVHVRITSSCRQDASDNATGNPHVRAPRSGGNFQGLYRLQSDVQAACPWSYDTVAVGCFAPNRALIYRFLYSVTTPCACSRGNRLPRLIHRSGDFKETGNRPTLLETHTCRDTPDPKSNQMQKWTSRAGASLMRAKHFPTTPSGSSLTLEIMEAGRHKELKYQQTRRKRGRTSRVSSRLVSHGLAVDLFGVVVQQIGVRRIEDAGGGVPPDEEDHLAVLRHFGHRSRQIALVNQCAEKTLEKLASPLRA